VRRCGASRGLLTQKNLHARDARTHPTLNVCTVSLARTQNGAQKCAKVVRYAARSGARDRSFSLPSLLFFFCEAPVSTPCHETTSSFRLGSLSLSLSLAPGRSAALVRTRYVCANRKRARATFRARAIVYCHFVFWRQIRTRSAVGRAPRLPSPARMTTGMIGGSACLISINRSRAGEEASSARKGGWSRP